MDIKALAARRARAAAAIEELSQIAPTAVLSDDRAERFTLRYAQARAQREYLNAERAYQSALSIMTTDELNAMGVSHG